MITFFKAAEIGERTAANRQTYISIRIGAYIYRGRKRVNGKAAIINSALRESVCAAFTFRYLTKY
jgi:hypothetical protein